MSQSEQTKAWLHSTTTKQRVLDPLYTKKENGKISLLDSTRKKYEVYMKWVSKDAEAHLLF